jgi:hypothetical protein
MAKLKHSFLKNSLLFCYRNVLNTDSETGNSKNDINTLSESDDEYIKINEIKRKLSTLNSTANTILNRQLAAPINSSEEKSSNISKKKMQNVLIHYSGNPAVIPDLVVSSKQQTPSISSNSPKSPVSKHAKHDENILPDIVKNDENDTSVIRRKSLSIKEKKKNSSRLNRSKSSATSKVNVDSYSRARILSPISNIMNSNSSSSSSSTTPEMIKNNKNAFSTPINNNIKPTKAAQTTTKLINYNSKEQVSHRQSYPPDSFSETNNYYNNTYNYSTVGIRSQLQNINDHLARKTIEYITSSPQRPKTSKQTTQPKPIEFEISYNYNDNSRSKNKNEETNGVKLRNSRPLESNEKPKRSLSAVSSTSTKKSVRFADSVGLELENIFNLSSFDNNPIDSKKISFLLSNHNYKDSDESLPSVYGGFQSVVKITPESNGTRKYVTRSNTISTPIGIDKNNSLTVTVSPSISDDNIKSDYQQQNKLKSNPNDSKQTFVKTIRLSNLTVRTRINKNGKLESEV